MYVLYSDRSHRTYVGQTKDLGARLKKHNAGNVRSTSPYLPWRVIHVEAFATRSEAMKRELWFKMSIGRRFIQSMLKDAIAG